jgi:hypothetical protein
MSPELIELGHGVPDEIELVVSRPEIVLGAPETELVMVPVRGQRGPTGPAGDQPGSLVFERQVGDDSPVSGHRVVRPNPDGSISYASNDDPADLGAPLWLTLQAGTEVSVCALGAVDEPSWSWTVGPLYLGVNGVLTQTPPTAAGGALFLVVVGYATGPNSAFIDPGPPISLI